MRKDWKDELRDSLEDFQVAEPEGLWEAVGSRVNAGRIPLVRRILVPLSVAAAAAAALFLIIRPAVSPSDDAFGVIPSGDLLTHNSGEGASGTSVNNGSASSSDATPVPNEPGSGLLSDSQPALDAQTASRAEQSGINTLVRTADTQILPSVDAQPEAEASRKDDASAYTEEKPVVADMGEDRECDLDEEGKMDFEEYLRIEGDGAPKRSGRTVGLMAMASGAQKSGSSARNYGALPGSDIANSLRNLSYEDPAYKRYSSLVASNIGDEVSTECTHRQPVRISLEAEFMIGEKLGIVSGLAYTRLVSDLTSGGGNSYHTVQKLDYLGIPLGLNFHMYDSRWLKLYAGAGAMAEKCVSGSARTVYSIYGEDTRGERLRVMDEPVVFSLDASVGAGIGLWKGGSLFFEPGLTWHIPDGGELDNIYRDRPLNFSISVGLRSEFGRKGR